MVAAPGGSRRGLAAVVIVVFIARSLRARARAMLDENKAPSVALSS